MKESHLKLNLKGLELCFNFYKLTFFQYGKIVDHNVSIEVCSCPINISS